MSRLAAAARRLWPAALGAATVAGIYGGLAAPGRVLAARDMAFLHLPLRTDFQRLLAGGLPGWDPYLHGGQPLLSNPHYAAWYPTTWLLAFLPPYLAAQWAILLHAALAFAGAWRLARRWGCAPPAAAFAAIAFTGSGYFAGLPSLLLIFFGMAWWPWVMAAADRALRPADPAPERRTRAVLVWAAFLALQILNGDPASVLASGLGCLALAWDAHRAGAAPWRRFAAGVSLALALAAVQVVPTLFRLRDSSRGAGLGESEAAVWSTRPLRLVETMNPHLFGDPVRDEEDLYFGWQLNDHEYPLLLSIYPGLLVTVLGIAALLRGGVPRRAALAAGVLAGVTLGIGRHEPLWPIFHRFIPFLAQLRYPEKFLLVALACLTFAAALELDRLLASRREDAGAVRRVFFFPLALAAACAIAAGIVAALNTAAPGAAANFVRSHSGMPPTDAAIVRGVSYLRHEALVALGLAVAVIGALLALRSRVSRGVTSGLVLVLLTIDLARHGRSLNPTLPRADFERAAPLAGAVPPGARMFSEIDVAPAPPVGLRVGPPGEQQLRARLARLEPLSATLWGRAEVLERDYDLMLTGWGRWALRLLREEWPNPDHAARLLDAWSVAARVQPRSPEELLADLRGGERHPAPARIALNDSALPVFRSVPEAVFHGDLEAALAAAREDGFAAGRREHLVGTPARLRRFLAATIEAPPLSGDRAVLETRSIGGPGDTALVVAAITFDDGWSASTANGPLPTWPTALGQLALEVPAGEQHVALRYRDPWVRVGGLLSIVALLGAFLAVSTSRGPSSRTNS